MSTGDNTPLCSCFPHSHRLDGHAGEVVDPEVMRDYSYSEEGEDLARKAAEDAFGTVVRSRGHGVGDYGDFNKLMRDEGL
jgi:hypothetical protein